MKDIITINATDLEGTLHEIEVPTDMGLNVMEALRAHGLRVQATCGGMALCATCNVRVTSDHELDEMSEDEEAMLDEAFVLDDEGSRLSCQIPVSTDIDGIELTLGKLTAGD